MKSESIVQQEIMADAPFFGVVPQRNNSGAFEATDGRHVRFGLMNLSKKQNEKIKSSDLICVTPIVITEEMVGLKLGVFTAIECKEEGWVFNPNDKREQAQKTYIDWIKSMGGFAGFASSVAEFRKIIGR